MSIRQTSAERLLAAIRAKNPTYVFEPADVSYGLPAVLDADTHFSERNTQLLVSATDASTRYILTQDVFYNRNDLDVLFTGVTDIGTITDASTAAVIVHLNELFGTAFQADDIFVVEFEEGGSYDGTHIHIQALTGSLGFVGTKAFTAVIAKTPLSVAIVNNILDGLEYPAIVLQPVEVITYNVSLAPEATNQTTGMMLHGNNNQITGFTRINDGSLELAIVARVRGQGSTPPYVDNVLQIPLTDNQDWNIHLSVALLGELSGGRIVDFYDVNWVVKNLDTNESMVWALRDSVINEGHQDWVCTSMASPALAGGTITDNTESLTGSVVQNIQRVVFYPNAFPNTQHLPGTLHGILGNFEISLNSRLKDTIAILQEVKVGVNVTHA